MKKLLALALAAVTLLCCLVGCSFGENNNKNNLKNLSQICSK